MESQLQQNRGDTKNQSIQKRKKKEGDDAPRKPTDESQEHNL